jgi:hypothetical protein
MADLTSAFDLLMPGEKGMVIFTEGHHFSFNRDGTGMTGYWVESPTRRVDRVIIYNRVASGQTCRNEVYTANHVGVVPGPNGDGRYTIQLTEVVLAGTTRQDWHTFANTQANPIRYLTHP